MSYSFLVMQKILEDVQDNSQLFFFVRAIDMVDSIQPKTLN